MFGSSMFLASETSVGILADCENVWAELQQMFHHGSVYTENSCLGWDRREKKS